MRAEAERSTPTQRLAGHTVSTPGHVMEEPRVCSPSREQVIAAIFGGTQRHVVIVKSGDCLADDQYGQRRTVGSEHRYGGETISDPLAECAF